MSDWKAAEEADWKDFLYIEEVNANDGTSLRLTGINTSQSVQDLKRAIAKELKNEAAWESIAVAFADTELSDLTSSLSNYFIQDGDTIFFTRSVTPNVPIPLNSPPPYSGEKILENLFFKDFDGRTMTLNKIPLSWNVGMLREKLGREKAIDVDDLRMLWGSKQLKDEVTLREYGVSEGCTIHLVARVRGGLL